MVNNLQAALSYLVDYHFSIVPSKNKQAIVPWAEYQKRLPTVEEVKAWWTKWPDANISLITGMLSGIIVIDADLYKMSQAQRDAFDETIPDSLLTPIAETPREGRHFYFSYNGTACQSKNSFLPYVDLKAEGGMAVLPPSLGDNGKPYKWIIRLNEHKPASLPEAYKKQLSKNSNAIINNSFSSYIQDVRSFACSDLQEHNKNLQYLTEGTRDEDIFHIANSLVKTMTPTEQMVQVLEIIGRSCNPPYPQKELMIKIKSALDRAARRERNLAVEVRNWTILQSGYFNLTETIKDLQILTKDEKNNLYVIIKRLAKEGLIEKYGLKSGTYRLVNNEVEKIDYLNVSDEKLDLSWPFQLEDLVKIMPKNIIVIAGVSNAGKTAFLLNFTEMNMDQHEIVYFSSEMGNMELKSRLSNFERDIKSWRFKPLERSQDFEDVISPNAINIIDFLEINDKHWEIGGKIKKIFDKLDKGIAIIAIQKKPGSPYAVGGATTIEKARLYVSLDSGKLHIDKGKNWANPLVNPNHLAINFKLIQGYKFIKTTDWFQEEKSYIPKI